MHRRVYLECMKVYESVSRVHESVSIVYDSVFKCILECIKMNSRMYDNV